MTGNYYICFSTTKINEKARNMKRKRTAIFLLAAALLPGFVRLVELVSPKGPELEIISRQIANAHTLFNICCALLWLPLLPWMVRLVCALVPEE